MIFKFKDGSHFLTFCGWTWYNIETYGQNAKLIGRPKNARLVGRALKQAGMYGDFPCHRVVNSKGRLTPGWEEQADLLEREGVTMKDAWHVDLKKHQWKV